MNLILKIVFQRLGLGVLTLIAVSAVIFSAIQMLPGDFASAILGQSATPETVKAFQHQIGLDKPAVQRYWEWIGGVAHGDFGYSFSSAGSLGGGHDRAVSDIIVPRLKNTLILASLAAVVAVPCALLLGILAALYRNSFFDRFVNSFSLAWISFPEFFIAYILMLYLSVKFQFLPSLASVSNDSGIGDYLVKCALPAMTLVLVTLAHMMRMTRTALVNLMSTPYVEMARLKGASRFRLICLHALPNAWAPIANVIALNLAYLVVGVVIVENVFVYPGIGQLMVSAVASRDIPVVQACALIFAATYILLNLTADIIGIVTNPKLLHRR
ncbi:MAG: ABC transporter permease [Rhodospirillaceae bacterium]|nr:MAG: ABC transporter permease [Rhodospirillaceae bacterium]